MENADDSDWIYFSKRNCYIKRKNIFSQLKVILFKIRKPLHLASPSPQQNILPPEVGVVIVVPRFVAYLSTNN